MTNGSMLAAVHNAIHTVAEAQTPDGEETGAKASETGKEETMSNVETKPGSEQAKGIPQAEHDAAVAKAKADGTTEATARLSAALGAEGIKGDANRMSAALDLATKSPAMSAEEVSAFVTANVAASAKTGTKSYEQGRTSASGLATPAAGHGAADKPAATIKTADIYAKRRG